MTQLYNAKKCTRKDRNKVLPVCVPVARGRRESFNVITFRKFNSATQGRCKAAGGGKLSIRYLPFCFDHEIVFCVLRY